MPSSGDEPSPSLPIYIPGRRRICSFQSRDLILSSVYSKRLVVSLVGLLLIGYCVLYEYFFVFGLRNRANITKPCVYLNFRVVNACGKRIFIFSIYTFLLLATKEKNIMITVMAL